MEINQAQTFQPCLEENANWISRLFYMYTQKLMTKGNLMAKKKQYLQIQDLYDCTKQNMPQQQYNLVKNFYDNKMHNIEDIKRNDKYQNNLAAPFLMKKIIEVLESDDQDISLGYVYATSIMLCLFCRIVMLQLGQGITKSILMQIQNGFSSSTIIKILNMSTASRNYYSNGKIMNMINVDQQDTRTRSIVEFIQGIKILKYHGWEDIAENQINSIRQSEFGFLLKNTYIRFSVEVMSSLSPVLVAVIVLSCYVGFGNNLTSSKAYSVQAYFNLILFPLRMFMIALISFIQSKTTIERMNQFMCQEEKVQTIQEDETLQKGELQIIDGSYSYETQKSFLINNNFKAQLLKKQGLSKKEYKIQMENNRQLQMGFANSFQYNVKNINFQAKPGNLYGVIGECSSGKSTLLLSLLGELHGDKNSQIKKNGKIAYVPQTAWLQNATIKNNIIFGQEYNEEKFQKVIQICQLSEDLKNITGGANAEIGDGSTLSGGQRQRISIARAVYSDADIYLIDDCLSALDAQVGNNIFNAVMKNYLKDKTIIFVTHSLKLMPMMDQILVFKFGEIVEKGTFEELSQKEDSEFLELAQDMQIKVEQEKGENYIPEQLDEFYGTKYYINEDDNGIPLEKSLHDQSQLDKYFIQSSSMEDLDYKIIDQEKNSQQYLQYKSYDNILEDEQKYNNTAAYQPSQQNNSDDKSLQLSEVVISDESQQQVVKTKNQINKKQQNGLFKVEERAQGSTSYKVYFNYLKAGGVGMLSTLIFLLFFAQSLKIGSDWWLGKWSEDAYELTTFQYILIYGISGVVVGIFFFLRGILFAKFSLKCANFYQKSITKVLFHTPMWWFDITPSSRIIQRCTKDQDDLDTYLPSSIINASIDIINIAGAIVLIMIILPFFIIPILIISVIFLKLIKYYLTSIREIKRIEAVTKAPVNQCLQECVSGLYIIRAYNREQDFVQRYYQKQRAYIVSITNLNYSQRWIGYITELAGVLIIAGTCYFAVLSKDFGTLGDASTMGLAISYSLQITSLLNSSLKRISEVEAQMNASVRMLQYINHNPQEKDRYQPQPVIKPWPTKGKIEIENLTYKYRPNLPEVIKQISFNIESKEKVGIVGRTGSGKSTMALGLLRIMEVSEDSKEQIGKIKIDGQDISQIGLHLLREKCTIIPQEAILFTGTLRFNIDPKNKFSDWEVVKALEQVGMWEQLQDLYETSCSRYNIKQKNTQLTDVELQTLQYLKTEQNFGETQVSQSDKQILEYRVVDGGTNFSLGQKQLICIARAIIKKPKVLIMDEATANIDEKTDYLNSLENKETQASSIHIKSFKSKQGSFEIANDDEIEHTSDIQKLKDNNNKRDSKFQQFQLLFNKLDINLEKRKELESIKNHDNLQKKMQKKQQRRQSLRQICQSLEKNVQNGDICMTPLKKSQSNLYNQYQNYDQDPEICYNMIKYENEKQFIYDQKNESLPGSAKQNSQFCNFSLDNNIFEKNLIKSTSLEKIEKDIQNNIYHENCNQQSDYNNIKNDVKIDKQENKLQNSSISNSSETSFKIEDSLQLRDTANTQSHTKINQEQQFLTTEALPTLLQKRKSQNKKFEQINIFHSTSCIRE
ncbi:P-loop containing nucleoside triphosphate hydrolase [Pseudocohnilembus persalinus]|uniref:p-loop containing nucleoside triphosphate hydrolase n=1 Tax=Pseudocohnilembus persalinus TaxID=266149 RepID=A0A0V0QG74_PSEPJ|nr:P-loop containing nucleoside triphosphate hydrolase [Pseudocohnilembus persalinus]|eukprot:KRX01144.1 P-loop containing nucleoside triphosphate hydrolase [Pseudocohnilembus persalinus]